LREAGWAVNSKIWGRLGPVSFSFFICYSELALLIQRRKEKRKRGGGSTIKGNLLSGGILSPASAR
jgi:hypothetical protein